MKNLSHFQQDSISNIRLVINYQEDKGGGGSPADGHIKFTKYVPNSMQAIQHGSCFNSLSSVQDVGIPVAFHLQLCLLKCVVYTWPKNMAR